MESGAPVTCVNEGNLKYWLHHREEKPLISLVTSFLSQSDENYYIAHNVL